jgi:hypothetical protein|tara:strand:- start:837 stop:1370 length:534 start_codon:yes stop_codon:yes gene_type:complete
MENTELDDAFFKAGTSFNKPIPGQSLMSDPDKPMPFEKAPLYTDRTDVLENFFEMLTEPKVYEGLLDTLETGITVMDVVQTLLYQGFREGDFNPDMMLLVAEPLAYMIAALAERADVDFIISEDDEDDEDDEEDLPVLSEKLSNIKNPQMDDKFPEELKTKIDNVEAPQKRSLLGAN